ncbi:MAG: 4Fe-4S dicluster domain-containing protein [Myxococcota bacterium]
MSRKKHLPTWSASAAEGEPRQAPPTEDGAAPSGSGFGRRTFLGFTGASAALGLSGCIRRPVENILPFTEQAEYRVPGVALHYATVTERRGEALGLLVTSHDGRPTKIEGNPVHPVTRGAVDAYGQAEVLNLYDPDRSQVPAKRVDGELTDSSWKEFLEAFGDLLDKHEADGGAGLRLLVQPTNSPSVRRMRRQVRERFPSARIHAYSPIEDENAREGAKTAFGVPVHTRYELDRADIILALDSDFMVTEPQAVRNARGFAARRRPTSPSDQMSRLYVVEGAFTVTGANADHRLRLPSRDVEVYLRALAAELASTHGADLGEMGAPAAEAPSGVPAAWVQEVAKELAGHRGRAPILVGSRQPARVHALAHALNEALGNNGNTVLHTPAEDVDEADLESLVQDLRGGRVQTLLVLGGNPAYDAPADFKLADLLSDDGVTSIHLSLRRDETSRVCDWHLPASHELEAWGDQQATDGTISVQQPLVAPLYSSRSELEVLATVAGLRNWRGHHVVRRTLRETAPAEELFESRWRTALHAGVVRGTAASAASDLTVDRAAVASALRQQPDRAPLGSGNIEVVFTVDYAMYDGRFANNPWMLELPQPLTKLVWDNAALLSSRTARELGVETGDVVRISREGGEPIEIAAFVLPGQADWVVTLPMGWGRRAAGRYGNGAGFDVFPARTSDALWFGDGASIEKVGRKHELVRAQEHDVMEGRPLAIDATLHPVDTNDPRYGDVPAYAEEPQFAAYRSVLPTTPPLWEEVDYSEDHKWGMTIDLSTCNGCNACVVACQAENNIPVVGKNQAKIGRMMHWIRIDHYLVGHDTDDPMVHLQPVACQHCEEAPCENVCPVNATTHSPDGLNDMAYNRCVGTRYCMNNCPYKVRRFNYLNWNGYLDDPTANYGEMPETVKMQKNPNVTVRFRGVMEKCTYCVQRIQEHKIAAKRENREVRTDEFTSACAQTCPSGAITFGNLNDPDAEVTRWATIDRSYKLLGSVGTQPRTTFLGKIRNPNPAMLKNGAGAMEATR